VSEQQQEWASTFGADYVARNPSNIEDYEKTYLANVGVTKTSLNEEFLADIPKSARILEVGTNVGMQLALLHRAGFENLYGVEIQWNAIDVLRKNVPRANVVHGSALDLPFRDGFFDLVFTSGVLIHINPFPRGDAPADLDLAMREIHRCSRRYILGEEYFAEKMQDVPYRGREQMMWKGDYSARYRQLFPQLRVVRERRLPHVASPNVDTCFLLEKA
jgi:pseudaminic acid biosynthesis-associated methylase